MTLFGGDDGRSWEANHASSAIFVPLVEGAIEAPDCGLSDWHRNEEFETAPSDADAVAPRFVFRNLGNVDRQIEVHTQPLAPVEQPEREAAADSASANGDEKSPLIKLITCVAKRTLTTARTTNASTEAPSSRTPLICAARAWAGRPRPTLALSRGS